jgi:alpha-tubulin suppressor-like RCC1 family protein
MRGHLFAGKTRWAATGAALIVVALVLGAIGLLPVSGAAVASEEPCPSAPAGASVVNWGYNANEQLGVGYKGGHEEAPRTVVGLSNVRQVKSGFEFALAVTSECTVKAWGQNRNGRLGAGNQQKTGHVLEVITESGPLTSVKEVAVGNAHSMALRYDGSVWTWGAAESGERGNGESGWERGAKGSEPEIAKPRSEAIEVTAVRKYAEEQSTTVKQLAAGGKRDYALLANGEVLGWGDDHQGILDVPEGEAAKCIGELHSSTPAPCVKLPTHLAGLSGIESLDASEDATYAVKNGGKEILAWGLNDKGELGDNSIENSSTPVKVELSTSSKVLEVSADGDFVLARLENGHVYSWGMNSGGQLGYENTGETSPCRSGPCFTVPQQIPGLDHVVAVSGGYTSSLALKEELGGEKTLYAFGHNGKYHLVGLGREQEESVFTPTPITGLPSVAGMSLSSTSGIALLEGEGPPRAVEVTPGHEQLQVTWHVAAEGFKLRWRPVGTREYSKSETFPACSLEPGCETFTLKEVPSEPVEVDFSTTGLQEGKSIILKTRKIFATANPAMGAPVNQPEEGLPYFTQEGSPEWLREAHALKAHPGSWSPAATSYTYEWLRCHGLGFEGSEEEFGNECLPIEHESVPVTGTEYTPTSEDRGMTIVVKATATNSSGSSAAVSDPELIIGSEEEEPPESPANITRPKVSGTPLIGHALGSEAGEWGPTSPGTAKAILTEHMFLCKGQVEDPEQESANETGGSCHEVGSGGSYTPEEPGKPGETAKEKAKNSPIGKWVEDQEHARNAGGTAEKSSLALQILPSGPPENLEAPKVGGLVEKGQTLKIEEEEKEGTWPNAAHWTNSPEKPTYQWYRCKAGTCSAIEGAEKNNYKITSTDVAYTLELEEKVENHYGTGKTRGLGSATSEPTIAVPALGGKPEYVKAMVLTGTAHQGSTLEVARGEWKNATTVSLAWKRCNSTGHECSPISGAKESTSYVLQEADVGHAIAVSEHAVSSGGTATEQTEPTALVTPAAPVLISAPTQKGTAQQGETLTESHGEWTNTPSGYSYKWLRCNTAGVECAEISGSGEQHYVAVSGDVGHTLRVRETASNAGGSSAPAQSAQTAIVKPAAPKSNESEPPTITGAAPPEKGAALTAHPGGWTPEATSYSYKWLRCEAGGGECTAISGATATTYTPVGADVGHRLAVEVRASNEGGWDHATSAPTEVVATPTPSVSLIEPHVGPLGGGATVTITGAHLGDATAVHFGSAAATEVHRVSETSVTAEAPAGTGVVDIMVTTPYGTSATNVGDEFTYVESPSITSVSPSLGVLAGGTKVIITGTNMTGVTAVDFGLTAATAFTVLSGSEVEAIAPAGGGTVDVTVQSPGGTSPIRTADHFTYVPAPSVSGLSPVKGKPAGGAVVTITGENLGEASSVKFGATAATELVHVLGTTLKATAPSGSGTVDVIVTTPYGTSTAVTADQFTYVPPPSISGVSPSAGPVAGSTVVTITGENLGEATAVKFGSTSATHFEQISGTTVKATSPAGSGTVDISVTTPYGTSTAVTADHFTYLGVPTVTNVNPTKVALAGEEISIEGTNFASGATVQVGSHAATGVKVESSTLIKAMAPAESPGVVDVVVTTPGGSSSESSKDHVTYAPEVTSLTPSTGPTAGGTTVTIKGAGFSIETGATTAKFGNRGEVVLTCTSTIECTTKSPAGAAGKVDVQITVNGATSLKGGSDHFTYE